MKLPAEFLMNEKQGAFYFTVQVLLGRLHVVLSYKVAYCGQSLSAINKCI